MTVRIILIASLVFGCIPSASYAKDGLGEREISVTGEAEVRVAPDELIIRLGIESHNEQLTVAKVDNDERVKLVLESIRSLGIKEEQIQTSLLRIEPTYERIRGERNRFTGYSVKNTIVVTLKDMSKFDRLVSDALSKGANRLYGISYHTSELRKHRDQARRMAVKHALEKATAMAGVLGRKVGKPFRIQEQYIDRHSSSGRPQQVYQQVYVAEGPSSGYASTERLAVGQIGVNARVHITFELD